MKTRHLLIVPICFFCATLPTPRAGALDGETIARSGFGGVQPRISPGGETIALSYQGAVCTMPAEGGTLTRLTRGEGWDIDPAWSPDGKRIAYINAPGFNSGPLRVIDAKNGSRIESSPPVRAQGPLFFHPDGARILGRFTGPGRQLRVGWLDLPTGEIALVNSVGPDDPAEFQRTRIAYALSNSGNAILFALHADLPDEQGGNNGQSSTIWKVSSNGGEPPEKIASFPARIFNLCWDSDDSGFFAVTNLGTSHYDIWRLPFENTLRDARKITSGQADEDWPSLSDDGQWLVHTENSRGATSMVLRKTRDDTAIALALSGIDFREPTGTLNLEILDEKSGSPVVSRISIKRQGGKFHSPVGSLYRLTGGFGHFYASEATIDLPVGIYELVTVRGLEYEVDSREVIISANRGASIDVSLSRWSNIQDQGWYSGENHVHANYGYGAWYNTPETILRQCQGEDLNVCNAVVANSDGDGVYDREFFRGQPDEKSTHDTILYWNQEFRSTLWGHMTLSNLSQLVEPVFTGFLQTTNPWDVPTNADVAQATLDRRGIVSYTHPAANFLDLYDQPYAAKGLPVDAALKRVHTMDVMGNTYRGSVLLWYKLLNCGFRIAASAGTDCFLNRITSYPPGWARAYVLMPGALTYGDWVAGQREGRAFITNGPMLELTIDGAALGDTIKISAPGEATIHGVARSYFPMEKLELIYNGDVVATGIVDDDGRSAVLEGTVLLERTGWIALRAEGPPAPYVVRQGLAAHTNPVFVELENSTTRAKDEAEYFLRWIDRLEEDFRRRDRVPTESARQHVLRQLDAAEDRAIRQQSAAQPKS